MPVALPMRSRGTRPSVVVDSGTKMSPVAAPLMTLAATTLAMLMLSVRWLNIQPEKASAPKPTPSSRRLSTTPINRPTTNADSRAPRPRGLTAMPLSSAE